MCVHTTFLHCAPHPLRGFAVTEDKSHRHGHERVLLDGSFCEHVFCKWAEIHFAGQTSRGLKRSAQDRNDLTFTTKEVAGTMSAPFTNYVGRQKRILRFVRARPGAPPRRERKRAEDSMALFKGGCERWRAHVPQIWAYTLDWNCWQRAEVHFTEMGWTRPSTWRFNKCGTLTKHS